MSSACRWYSALGAGLGARVEVGLDRVLDSSAGRGVPGRRSLTSLPVLRRPGRASVMCPGLSVHTTPCTSAVVGGGRESSSNSDSSSSSEHEVPSQTGIISPSASVDCGRHVPRGGSSVAAGSPSSPSLMWTSNSSLTRSLPAAASASSPATHLKMCLLCYPRARATRACHGSGREAASALTRAPVRRPGGHPAGPLRRVPLDQGLEPRVAVRA